MKISRFEEAEGFETPEGIMRPLFASGKIAVTQLNIPAGLKVEPHSHPGDGIFILTEGSIELISEKTVTLRSGDLAYIPGNTEVGLESHEDSDAIILSVPSRYETIDEFREVLKSFAK
jgi:quercetin dioxygenase-like cupin family protein